MTTAGLHTLLWELQAGLIHSLSRSLQDASKSSWPARHCPKKHRALDRISPESHDNEPQASDQQTQSDFCGVCKAGAGALSGLLIWEILGFAMSCQGHLS